MKLKGLGNRAYNVLFHTHTVAGIVISFALFVIFYAGAFTLFRDDFYQWENPAARIPVAEDFDYDKAFEAVDKVYDLDRHSITNIAFPDHHDPFFQVYGAVHDTDSTTERMAAYVEPGSYSVQDITKPLTTVGITLFRLHYFRQIPVIGLYLSGFVALFFLFASITGLLIHWRNLLTKFYAFIVQGKWKQIWTNAHTVLGVIGLPFQIVYAVTGAFFGLLSFVLLPSVLILYGGDSSKVFNILRPENAIELEHDAKPADNISMVTLKKKIEETYPGYRVTRAAVRNYGLEDALITWTIKDGKGIATDGRITMYMSDGIPIEEASLFPAEKKYYSSVIEIIGKLHFADFGGFLIRVVYFVLSMITCFMIISGILLWQAARDNNRYTEKQRKFHHKVTKVYLAICLSMFPAFAIIFIANKMVPIGMEGRAFLVNTIFFSSWLLLFVIGCFWNSYARQNKNYLIIGGVLSLLVPLVNGIATGDWFWLVLTTFPNVAGVDISWLLTGLIALVVALWVLKIPEQVLAKKVGNTKQIRVEETELIPEPAVLTDGRKTP
ncbi:PepSY-associated TM helix domain-containing protein [Fulvivirgaceae bacterium BMA12]|uniref:PepSY-associated TM helix domain-containing protein n=1 Tax=Agaribacillus aureus TaxID=3051825 RepID=A0ABT8LLT5_9BACT|nr:PepSY-associated TM helix domain-containing protein [Fulvivirgaceae bacterium BMA12]